MSLRLEGRVQDASLLTGAFAMLQQGLWVLAVVVVTTTVLAPLLKLGGTFFILAGLRLARPPRYLPMLFRWHDKLRPWVMIEVFLLGVFVAYAKLVALATIEVGVAVYSLAALMVVMAVIDIELEPEMVWQDMARRGLLPVRAATAPETSAGQSTIRCDGCGFVNLAGKEDDACWRCDARLRRRKENSLARTWALVAAAAILYVPANLFPVLTVVSFGSGEPDTIISGVVHLLQSGMWPLALLVFFASITVPLLKLLSLIILLIATQRGSRWRLADRTLLYRVVELIGRWSMIGGRRGYPRSRLHPRPL
jgi:paraquat-inducible protein A